MKNKLSIRQRRKLRKKHKLNNELLALESILEKIKNDISKGIEYREKRIRYNEILIEKERLKRFVDTDLLSELKEENSCLSNEIEEIKTQRELSEKYDEEPTDDEIWKLEKTLAVDDAVDDGYVKPPYREAFFITKNNSQYAVAYAIFRGRNFPFINSNCPPFSFIKIQFL